jgi:adenosylhomocysteine nucleosidase
VYSRRAKCGLVAIDARAGGIGIIGLIEGRRLLIFTAVRAEATAVADALGARLGRGVGPVKFCAGQLPVELHIVGIGARRVPREVGRETVCGIILAGLAGALDPELAIGDVIVEGLPEGCALKSKVRRGRIHAAAELVATPAQKGVLFRETGAAAVEMEGERVRRLAREIGVPYLGIRGISDRADEAIDPAVLGLVDELGRPRPFAIAWTLLRRPGMAGDLKRLGAGANLAAQNMAAVVEEFVTSAPDALGRWLESGA